MLYSDNSGPTNIQQSKNVLRHTGDFGTQTDLGLDSDTTMPYPGGLKQVTGPSEGSHFQFAK